MVDTPKRYEPMKNIVITGWKQYTKDRRKTIITNCFGSKGVSEIIHHFPVKLFFKNGKNITKIHCSAKFVSIWIQITINTSTLDINTQHRVKHTLKHVHKYSVWDLFCPKSFLPKLILGIK